MSTTVGSGLVPTDVSEKPEEFDPYAEDSEYESYVIELPPNRGSTRSRSDWKNS
jgi:hypothetical protein